MVFVATLLSSLVFVVNGVVWIRSYWFLDEAHWSAGAPRSYLVRTGRGIVQFEVCQNEEQPDWKWNWDFFELEIYLTEDVPASEYRPEVERWEKKVRLKTLQNAVKRRLDELGRGFRFEVEAGMPYEIRGGLNGEQALISSRKLRFWGLAAPAWFTAMLTAMLPARWVWQRKRAAGRARAGFCLKCGYDLHATPERCPECGTGIGACD